MQFSLVCYLMEASFFVSHLFCSACGLVCGSRSHRFFSSEEFLKPIIQIAIMLEEIKIN